MPTELCNEVGDPANFYFIYPAESKINGYLDINQAVKQDAGQTSVCMIYLTHMIGKARAVAMMVDKKALAEHLAVVKMQDFENKGFEVIVLRYSDLPIMKPTRDYLINVPMMILILLASAFAIPTLLNAIGPYIGLNKLDELSPKNAKVIRRLLVTLIGIGIPSFFLIKLMNALRNERARAHELESQQMKLDLQKWEEPPAAAQNVEGPRLVAAGQALDRSLSGSQRNPSHLRSRHKSGRSRRSPRRSQEKALKEFSRLRAQSQEAMVAGGADPRFYRKAREASPQKSRPTAEHS